MESTNLKENISLVLSLYSKNKILQKKIDKIKIKQQLELQKLYVIGNIIEENIYDTNVIDNIIDYIKSCEVSSCISTEPGCSKRNHKFKNLVEKNGFNMINDDECELVSIFDFGKHVYRYYYLDSNPNFDTLGADFHLEIMKLNGDYVVVKLLVNPGFYSDNLEFIYTLDCERIIEFLNRETEVFECNK